MVAGRVANPEDDDGVAFDAVEELVRKALGQDPPEPAVVKGRAIGRLFQPGERIRHRSEGLAQSPGNRAANPQS